jgi:DNA-binding IclR family transcriptional regulator
MCADKEVPMTEVAEPAQLTNKSVTKAGRLLRELAAHPQQGVTVTALAKAVGMSRPTTFRLLHSLEQSGLVHRVDNHYVLGHEMARLGRLADPHTGLAARAQPLLQELADRFNHSVSMSVPNTHDGLDLIAQACSPNYVAIGLQMSQLIGPRAPLHASSFGKVLLAEMPEDKALALLPERLEAYTDRTITDRAKLLSELRDIRKQGFGVVDGELEDGLMSLSCPVRDSAGTMVAVLTLNGSRHGFDRDRIPDALGAMREMVDRLTDVFWHEVD